MRDPQGRIRFEGERVLRTLVRPLPADHFLQSPLAARWVAERRLVAFDRQDDTTLMSPRLPFVTQPTEWCDAQLHDAAALTLAMQREAVSAGFDLKDASAWNVLFDGCQPIFCDLLSFVPLAERKWWAMGQYARHFLFPLLASRRRGLRAHEVFTMWRDGMAAPTARRLFGRGLYMTRYGSLLLGESGSGATRHSALADAPQPDAQALAGTVSFRNGLHSALEWMLAGVAPRPLRDAAAAGWAGYEQDRPHYGGDSLQRKRATVADWLSRVAPAWVLDMGCNTGEFSRMAVQHGAQVVALDADHDSIERLYRETPAGTRLYPLVARLDDIGAGRGWAGGEHPGLAQRLAGRFDLVMMLALVHHLAIGAAVPLEEVARFAAGCTRDALIVELIDASDPQLVSLCNQRQRRPEEFSVDRQRAAFRAAGLRIEAEVDLAPAGRTLALLRRGAE
ncbi:class I SAM-dependent methyltransferase [Rhizobacter sp. OV335]|uniref:class I SAM-dependent methyltransferase n=1 Tax=Rhizobacter sp. OV335 TaxID=1500264 RepID=UPI000919149B|nr:class I SAM-dependent methyltransferase [Rhizobacter sp. OV335]SHL95376.1 Methyltransferase domain-containing protein [Rhizobacter sp. OV335]